MQRCLGDYIVLEASVSPRREAQSVPDGSILRSPILEVDGCQVACYDQLSTMTTLGVIVELSVHMHRPCPKRISMVVQM